MANDDTPEKTPGAPVKLPGDELPPFPPADLPTDPVELEAWREEYATELVGRPYDEWSQNPVHRSVHREGGMP